MSHTTQGLFPPTEGTLSAALQQLRSHFENRLRGAPCDDPLSWWKQHTTAGSTLAVLAPLARMYLAIPASSADLERSFSSTGFILEGRSRLLVRNLETQAVIRDYLVSLERSLPVADYLARVDALIASLEAEDPADEEATVTSQTD